MKINQIISEMATVAGSVASVAKPMGETQKRPTVRGLQPVGTSKKKKAPYANSLSEGKVKDLAMDLTNGKDGLNDAEFKKKYGKSKEEMRKSMQQKPKQPVSEEKLDEDDIIVVPGQGMKRKTGFVPHGQSRVDREVEMAKSDLFQLLKNTKTVLMIVKDMSEDDGLEGWVQEKIIKASDYMNTLAEYFEGKGMSEEITSGGVIAGGGVGEGVAEGSLNEFAPDGFNDGDDYDLELYLNVAKKLNMKKYKPSTAHNLISKKMAALVDVVDDEKVDWARHMARKAQGLPNMIDQQGVAEGTDTASHYEKAAQKQGDTVAGRVLKKMADKAKKERESKQGVASGSDSNTQSHAKAFKSETDTMKPGTKKYVGRKDGKEVHAKKDAQGNVKFYHRDGIKGPLKGVAEGEYNPDTFVGKKGTYKGYGITQEGPHQWGISSSVRKFPTLNAAKRHIDKNLVLEQGVAEGAKVDRMVKHIAKSERGLGHSKKEAENIAWATANRRGMLDNKNKRG